MSSLSGDLSIFEVNFSCMFTASIPVKSVCLGVVRQCWFLLVQFLLALRIHVGESEINLTKSYLVGNYFILRHPQIKIPNNI